MILNVPKQMRRWVHRSWDKHLSLERLVTQWLATGSETSPLQKIRIEWHHKQPRYSSFVFASDPKRIISTLMNLVDVVSMLLYIYFFLFLSVVRCSPQGLWYIVLHRSGFVVYQYGMIMVHSYIAQVYGELLRCSYGSWCSVDCYHQEVY